MSVTVNASGSPVNIFFPAGGGGGDQAALLLESGSAAKTTDLPAAGALSGAETTAIVQGGVSKEANLQDIADLAGGGGVTTISITQEQLTTAFTTPIEVATAPGPSQIKMPNPKGLQYLATGSHFPTGSTARLRWGSNAGPIACTFATDFSGGSTVEAIPPGSTAQPLLGAEGSVLYFCTDADLGVYGPIDTASVNSSGGVWTEGATIVPGGGSNDATLTVTAINPPKISGGAIIGLYQGTPVNITAVAQGPQTFEVAGDQTVATKAGKTFLVAGSTGNDGTYTLAVDGVFAAGATTVTTVEAIPDATVDGTIRFSGVVTVAGNQVASLSTRNVMGITGSTGNDGAYNYTTPFLNGDGDTAIYQYIPQTSPFPDATVDGTMETCGQVDTIGITDPGTAYTTAVNVIVFPATGLGDYAFISWAPDGPATGVAQLDLTTATIASLG